MISFDDNVFRLTTEHTSYWFCVTRFGHLEHIYYGSLLPDDQSVEPLMLKRTAQTGGSVLYDPSDETYCLDTLLLEWSGIGKGDYRDTRPPKSKCRTARSRRILRTKAIR